MSKEILSNIIFEKQSIKRQYLAFDFDIRKNLNEN